MLPFFFFLAIYAGLILLLCFALVCIIVKYKAVWVPRGTRPRPAAYADAMLPVGREYIRVGYYGFGVGSFFFPLFPFFSGVGMGMEGWTG